MNLDDHERARQLTKAERVEGIASEDRRWLDAHLDICPSCTTDAKALAFAVDSLRSVSVTASPDLVYRTSVAVRRLAERRREYRERALPLWIAAGVACAWMILTAPLTWSLFSWIGHVLNVADVVWQFGFLTWWFLPATVLGAAAAWQHAERRGSDSNRAAEMDWR